MTACWKKTLGVWNYLKNKQELGRAKKILNKGPGITKAQAFLRISGKEP